MSAQPLHRGVSVVVPVFGGGSALAELVSEIFEAANPEWGAIEVILVDDASALTTSRIATTLAREIKNVLCLRLGRNSGQHAALLAGIREAKNDIVVTIDDDFQNSPKEIGDLIERLTQGDVDVVYGFTPRTGHSLWRRLASRIARRIIAAVIGANWARHVGPFRAFRADLRNGFIDASGPDVSVDVLLSWSTQRFGFVEVSHENRRSGQSGYTVRKLIRFAFDTVTGYSTALLGLVTWLGLISVGFGLLVLVWVLGRYAVNGTAVAGFPFLASTIALFSGAQMLSISILGQYLGRIHLRTQGRPTYHIVDKIGAVGAELGQGDVA